MVVPATAQSQSDAVLRAQLTNHLKTLKKDQQVVRFFQDAPLAALRPPVRGRRNGSSPATARAWHCSGKARSLKGALHRRTLERKRQRRLASLRSASPAVAICKVFGSHCGEALRVSRCESGLRIDARNGEYLGLFQMGSKERRAVRSRADRDRAGEGGAPVLRRLGPQLACLVVQALELSRNTAVSCAKSGTRRLSRVPPRRRAW